RHGRQHSPGRPQRSTDSDAVERRLEWRLFYGRSGKSLFAADSQPRVWLPDGERVIAKADRAFPALLDEAHHADTPFQSGVRVGLDRVSLTGESPRAGRSEERRVGKECR